MKFDLKLPNLPRRVAASLGLIAVSGLAYGALVFTLAAQRDAAVRENARLTSTLAQSKQESAQAREDLIFVNDNLERFETLIQGERLVPHTRRDAVRRVQTAALARGLTSLSYDFSVASDRSPAAVASQVAGAAFRVNVESIILKIGSPLDGLVYQFLLDLEKDFPGSVVLQSLSLERAPKVTAAMLDQTGRGQDAGLVKGEMKLLWRTAQANDAAKKTP